MDGTDLRDAVQRNRTEPPLLRRKDFWFLAIFWTLGMALLDAREAAAGQWLSARVAGAVARDFLSTLPFGMLFGWLMVLVPPALSGRTGRGDR